LIFLDDGEQEFAIDFVEAVLIDFQHLERRFRGGEIDVSGGADLRVVADSAEQAIGDAGRASGTAGDFGGAFAIDFHAEDFCGTLDDDAEIIVRVELEAQQKAEARAQRGGEQARARGGSDESEGLHVHGVGASGRALADHDVEFVVFERGVEDLFERGLEAMHFVDEEDLLVVQVRKDRGEITFDLERGTRSLLESGAKFVGDDVGKRGFAKAGRAVEENVVECFAAGLGGLDGNVEILFDFVLADEFDQALRAELEFKGGIVLDGSRRDETVLYRDVAKGGIVVGGWHLGDGSSFALWAASWPLKPGCY